MQIFLTKPRKTDTMVIRFTEKGEMAMRIVDLIEKKKNGSSLNKDEIRYFAEGFTRGEIPDYQAAALLMAICFVGMTTKETADLTDCMAHSGDTLDLSDIDGVTADKHSTGGVGDKTTLIVAPICAASGLKMAKMSGRGLGHTGGTIDKLESIPGFRTALSETEFKAQVNKFGLAVTGQTGCLAPADKKIYALRDVTATVNSIPLIASSIMSKKIAAGAQNIVLDVKCGSGAFMQNAEDARALAEQMVAIGKACGRNTAAVLTNMDVPLGTHIGNALEVTEACAVLKNSGSEDLREISLRLSAHLISMSMQISYQEARRIAERTLRDGSAFRKLREMVAAQGGDVRVLEQSECFLSAEMQVEIHARQTGYIARMHTQKIGESASLLGAGRERKNDAIDYAAGIVLCKKTGDFVHRGDILAVLYANSAEKLQAGAHRFSEAFTFSDAKPEVQPLCFGTVE